MSFRPRASLDAGSFSPAPPLPLQLPLGLELDFNICGEGGVWLPARVCELLPCGSVSVRVALTGTVEVCVPLPPQVARARLAPAGVHTVPLLDGQPVDFLRRAAPVAPSMCYLEQWQGGEVSGYPEGGAGAGGRSARFRVLSVGGAVLGVTYGMGGRSVGLDGCGEAALVDAPVGAVAAGTLFSKRVPTVADVALLPVGELPRPPVEVSLPERSDAAFSRAGEVAALLDFGGRRALRDFDWLDVLPPLRRGDTAAPAGGAFSARGDALEPRLLALAAALPGAELVCPLPLDAPGGLPSAAGVAFRKSRGVVFKPAPGGAVAVAEAPPAGLQLGAHAVATPWRPARVRTLAPAEAAALVAALTQSTRRRASFFGRSATFGDADAWDLSIDDAGGGGGGGARKPEAAAAAPQPYAFWFELAARSGDGGGATTLLRFAPLAALRAVAPPGSRTWPWVPGQAVRVRRLGGPWGDATVEAADRLLLRLRRAGPPAPAPAPARANLPSGGCVVRVDTGLRARVGGGGAPRWSWWGGAAARAAAVEAAEAAAAAAGAPLPLHHGATLLAVVGASEEEGGGAAATPLGGDEEPLPVPLGAGADGVVEPGCEVVPAQLWGVAVRRAGGDGGARNGAKGAAAALLAAAKRAAGADGRHLIGPHVPL